MGTDTWALRETREKLGVSGKELCDFLGVSYTVISRYENGFAQPSALMEQLLTCVLEAAQRDGWERIGQEIKETHVFSKWFLLRTQAAKLYRAA